MEIRKRGEGGGRSLTAGGQQAQKRGLNAMSWIVPGNP